MSENRFEWLPKKDRDYVVNFVKARPEYNEPLPDQFCDCRDRLITQIKRLETRPVGPAYHCKSATDLVQFSIDFLSSELLQRSVADRLLNDNFEKLITGLQLVSRLKYVENLAKTDAYSLTDCHHIFSVVESLAVNDTPAVRAYTDRYPSIAKSGGSWTKLYCNGVMMLLRGETDDSIVANLQKHNGGKYDQAVLSAVAAISKLESERLTILLEMVLSGHRRKDPGGLLKYFCVTAHGIFNLASGYFASKNLPPPREPAHALWDVQFHDFLQNGKQDNFDDELQVIETLHPQLATWARDVPETVDRAIFETLF